jgi:primosomal protein N' (replication factor Y)
LHGATASGKTHIYASIIQDIILQNGQVLYLVPEIALTTQLVKRLSILFGNVSVYHSKFNPAERIETWLHVASGKANIIIGARSALFLPFTNLKLIILDEEHDSSFKQSETNPKYHARNVAQYLAHLHSSKVLLGSATPSFDSYFLAKKGKIGLVTLQERYFENEKPEIKLIKLDSKTLPPHGMSDALLDNINLQLKEKKQSILFYHRRAFAPYIVCTQCEWVPYCKHCDIALNYHKWSNDLKCHICGYKQNIPKKCPACANTYIIQKGIGTERIEEDTQIIFPEATIARMDQDTTRQKNSHEKILAKLEEGELDILVGTQMVTKGIDTNNVNLVAVLNTDVLFHFSDFRAKERAMQLLLQVMGRAGRRNQRGVVVLQAYNIHNEYIKSLDNFDFKELFDKEIIERNLFNYPPFSKLIIIQLKHKELEVVEEAALSMAAGLKEKYKDAILGPAEPHISKVKNLFLRDIMVKINPNTYHIDLIKEDIFIVAKKITQYEKYRQVSIVYDVDPY